MFRAKTNIFYEHLRLITKNVADAAVLFQRNIENPGDTGEYAERIRILEHMGDGYTHVVGRALDRMFITPIERDDLMNLTGRLDDVLDGIEASAGILDVYNLGEPDGYLCSFARMLVECAGELRQAVDLLTRKKYPPIYRHIVRINALENEADHLKRHAFRDLFAAEKDVRRLMQKKEAYESISSVFVQAEAAAGVLAIIVMRG
ncbi:MAG: DUF47 family protein [Peptococcaceae bacterium]|nr:DUF47 family protein [Peptococcaceae bacterium]